jgi:nicotinate-nucleotide--dimethylbenzimidazole phosphoribosyltransferase
VSVQAADDSPASLDVSGLAARINLPDEDARRTAQAAITESAGALGRLTDVAGWLAAVQGRYPTAPFERIRVIVVGAPPSPLQALAEQAGVGIRAVDPPVAPDDAAAGFLAGMSGASDEVDAGADLLVLSGGSAVVPAAALVALLTSTEVAVVVGHQPGADDRDWMKACAQVRDAARRGRPVTGETLTLLATVGAAEVAVAAGALAEATARRTPVLIDDLVPAAAALVAQRISYRTTRWLAAAHRTADPAQQAALDRLRLTPLLDYGLASSTHLGAVLAVPHLQAAAMLLHA